VEDNKKKIHTNVVPGGRIRGTNIKFKCEKIVGEKVSNATTNSGAEEKAADPNQEVPKPEDAYKPVIDMEDIWDSAGTPSSMSDSEV